MQEGGEVLDRGRSSDPSSPPTARVVDVIELIARDPAPVRLADLVRRLDITQGTAHAIVSTLCDRGWLSRSPEDRSYTPGPALGSVSARASGEPTRTRARIAAAELAESLGMVVSVTERIGETMLILAYEGHAPDADVAVGDRVPYAAPLGMAFAAWETEHHHRTWIGASGRGNPELSTRVADALLRIRQRGYSVERMSRTLAQTLRLIAVLRDEPATSPLRPATDDLLAEITTWALRSETEPDLSPLVTSIAAPVFDAHGRVTWNLSAHPLRDLTSKQIASIGQRLTRTAAVISSPEPNGDTP